MQASALTAWDLTCRRGDRVLFGGLDLRLERGAALQVTGPNGAGKTSLLRMLAGLLPPGFAERRAHDRPAVLWQGSIGLVDERPALDETLPLGAALGFWARLDGRVGGHPAAALAEAMARLGLASLAEVPVRYLSTGQRKRAAFARLLAQEAEHWLLDEPLNGLDAQGTALVEALIAERRAGGGAVIVASHQSIDLPGATLLDLRRHAARLALV